MTLEQTLDQLLSRFDDLEKNLQSQQTINELLIKEYERPLNQKDIAILMNKSQPVVCQLVKSTKFPPRIKGTSCWNYADVLEYIKQQKNGK